MLTHFSHCKLLPQNGKANNFPKPLTGKRQSWTQRHSLTPVFSIPKQLSVLSSLRKVRETSAEGFHTNHYDLSSSHIAVQLDQHIVTPCHIRKRSSTPFLRLLTPEIAQVRFRHSEKPNLQQGGIKDREKAAEILLFLSR